VTQKNMTRKNMDLEDYAALLTRIVKANTLLFPNRPTVSILIMLAARKLEVGGGMNASSLAAATLTPRPSVVRRLVELERQGYVVRREDGLFHATDLAVSSLQIHRDIVLG
jgi:DNA-binding transcriptional ArsR family regulator